MTRKIIHVALNGVTGRMGYRQHLVRSLLSIREQGGVRLPDGTTCLPGHGPATTIGEERRSNPFVSDAATAHGAP